MSDQRGVFTLRTTNIFRKKEQWVDLNDVWHSPSPGPSAEVGYFGGGYYPGPKSIMDKVTYTSDTTVAVPGANLTSNRSMLAATGSPNAGYFGGGNPTGLVIVNKLNYSGETTALVPGANLTSARSYLGATGNSTAGYFAGGFPGPYSTMDKTTYSTDTTAQVPGANLGAARYYLAATGNQTHGYFGGGQFPYMKRIEKTTYSTDTTALIPTAAFPNNRRSHAATGNSTHGYFGGGYPGPYSTIDKVTYSNDTTATLPSGANFNSGTTLLAATGNTTHGYFGGGTPGQKSTMNKLNYSNDTAGVVSGAALSVGRYNLAATSPRANALPAVADASSAPATRYIDGAAPSPNTGYFGGGSPGPGVTIVDKIDFTSDTTARVPGANLTQQRLGLAATSSTTDAYFAAGRTAPSPYTYHSLVEKTTYASDTTARAPGADLSLARELLGAAGNITDGYFGGGRNPSNSPDTLFSTMDKVTYSSDTAAAVPGAVLSYPRRQIAGTGNADGGYFVVESLVLVKYQQ